MAIRRSGQSTRIIDNAIQELFTKGETIIIDHFTGENTFNPLANQRASEYTAKRFERRLNIEHPHVLFKKERTEQGYIKFIATEK